MATKFIKKAIGKNKGALRKTLGIKTGQTIPLSTLKACSKKSGILGRRCRFALNIRGLRKGK